MILIDGKKIRDEILADIKSQVALLSFQPVFCDVLVGVDPVSAQYVDMKAKTAERVGIHFHKAVFPASITTSELIQQIGILNKMKNMCGIIVQLPLPKSIDKKAVLDSIDPRLDVDCLGGVASEKFYTNYDSKKDLAFPTGLACMALLKSIDVDLKDKNIVVLGQGDLVGKPVSALLRYDGFNPITVVRLTENKELIFKQADVIISGIGNGKYITDAMIKPGVILIDAGTSEDVNVLPGVKKTIVGDVDVESVKNVASYVSPVPGGVGPVTVAILLSNVLKVAKTLK